MGNLERDLSSRDPNVSSEILMSPSSLPKRNSSDLGVCLSSMPVNRKGRVAIRVLNRQSRGDFEPIDAKSTSWSTSSPTSPGKDFALATLSWLSPIRRPCLWYTLIGAILCPYGAGTPKSEHLLPKRVQPTQLEVEKVKRCSGADMQGPKDFRHLGRAIGDANPNLGQCVDFAGSSA